MNKMEKFASSVPYMVLPGNHEAECLSPACRLSPDRLRQLGNYSAYNHRYHMPFEESGATSSMWYSFNSGVVHFISLNTESDYEGAPRNTYTPYGRKNPYGNFGDQLTWLKRDLAKAHRERHLRPWIIVGIHRPMYSVIFTKGDGTPTGQAKKIQLAFEALFLKYKVDIVFQDGRDLIAIEIKSASTFSAKQLKGLKKFKTLSDTVAKSHLVYSGEPMVLSDDIEVLNFNALDSIFV